MAAAASPLGEAASASGASTVPPPAVKVPFAGTRHTFEHVPSQDKPSETNKGWSCGKTIRWAAVAFAVAAVVAGVIGVLIFTGQLQIAWTGAGAIGEQAAFWIMVGGFGGAAISALIATVTCCTDRAERNAEKQRARADETLVDSHRASGRRRNSTAPTHT